MRRTHTRVTLTKDLWRRLAFVGVRNRALNSHVKDNIMVRSKASFRPSSISMYYLYGGVARMGNVALVLPHESHASHDQSNCNG